MQFGKNEKAEVKVKSEIEGQRVREKKGGRVGEREGEVEHGKNGQETGCLKGVDFVLINNSDVCIHPTYFTFFSFTRGRKCV